MRNQALDVRKSLKRLVKENTNNCTYDGLVGGRVHFFFRQKENGQAVLHKIEDNQTNARRRMNPISKKMGLQPDILDGATIVKAYGDEYAIIENYKSIIEYTDEIVKLQGKHVKVVIGGNCLCIESFEPDECRVFGKINEICLVRF